MRVLLSLRPVRLNSITRTTEPLGKRERKVGREGVLSHEQSEVASFPGSPRLAVRARPGNDAKSKVCTSLQAIYSGEKHGLGISLASSPHMAILHAGIDWSNVLDGLSFFTSSLHKPLCTGLQNIHTIYKHCLTRIQHHPLPSHCQECVHHPKNR